MCVVVGETWEGVIPIHRTELWKLKLDFSNQSVKGLEGDIDHKTK